MNNLAKVFSSNLNRNTKNRNINEIEQQHERQYEDNINMVSLNNEIESIRQDSDEDYMVNLIAPTEGPTTPTKFNVKFGKAKY